MNYFFKIKLSQKSIAAIRLDKIFGRKQRIWWHSKSGEEVEVEFGDEKTSAIISGKYKGRIIHIRDLNFYFVEGIIQRTSPKTRNRPYIQ